jgi:hypothetical protein
MGSSYGDYSDGARRYDQNSELSAQTFECFVCKKNGVPGVQIYLKGKDAKGFPIRIELDKVTPHRHKGIKQSALPAGSLGSQQTQQLQKLDIQDILTSLAQQRTVLNSMINNINNINQKLDVVITTLKIDPNDDDGDWNREHPGEEGERIP